MEAAENRGLTSFRPERRRWATPSRIRRSDRDKPVLARLTFGPASPRQCWAAVKCDLRPATAAPRLGRDGRRGAAGLLFTSTRRGGGLALPTRCGAYSLQDQGFEHVRGSKHRAGARDDERDSAFGAGPLRRVGFFPAVRLDDNKPPQASRLMQAEGIAVTERVPSDHRHQPSQRAFTCPVKRDRVGQCCETATTLVVTPFWPSSFMGSPPFPARWARPGS